MITLFCNKFRFKSKNTLISKTILVISKLFSIKCNSVKFIYLCLSLALAIQISVMRCMKRVFTTHFPSNYCLLCGKSTPTKFLNNISINPQLLLVYQKFSANSWRQKSVIIFVECDFYLLHNVPFRAVYFTPIQFLCLLTKRFSVLCTFALLFFASTTSTSRTWRVQ
jgi:hypothetical protein